MCKFEFCAEIAVLQSEHMQVELPGCVYIIISHQGMLLSQWAVFLYWEILTWGQNNLCLIMSVFV